MSSYTFLYFQKFYFKQTFVIFFYYKYVCKRAERCESMGVFFIPKLSHCETSRIKNSADKAFSGKKCCQNRQKRRCQVKWTEILESLVSQISWDYLTLRLSQTRENILQVINEMKKLLYHSMIFKKRYSVF